MSVRARRGGSGVVGGFLKHRGCARNARQAVDIPKPRIARSIEMAPLFRLVLAVE
jgi:hypothetical protein